MANNDPVLIPYVIQEGSFWYVAYKEKVKVPEVVVSAKGVANGLSEEYNDGWDFGPDSYDPTSTANPPYTQTSGIQEACDYSFSVYGYTYVKIIGQVLQISNTIYLHSEGMVIIEGIASNNQAIPKTGVPNTLSTIQQNAVMPIFANYNSSAQYVFATHIFKNLELYLNIGDNTTKAMYFNSTASYNVNSIYIRDVRFNAYNTNVANYSLYSDNAFYRVIFENPDHNGQGWTIYAYSTSGYASLFYAGGMGYLDNIVASMNFIRIVNTNFYGTLTVNNSGTTVFDVYMDNLQFRPATTGGLTLQYEVVNVQSSLNSLTIKNMHFLVGPTAIGSPYNLVKFSGTSSTSITIGKVVVDNISFILTPNSTTTYSINLYSLTYATVNELRTNMVRALSSEITLTGVADILPSPTLSANPPVSGTVYQNTNPYDIEIDLPAYATTAGTAGYVTLAKGTTDTPTAIGSQYVSGGTSDTSEQIIRLRVPAGWYYSFTASGVTLGTASVFAE